MGGPIMADTGEMEELQNVLRLQVPQHRPRVPLGTILLEDGAITTGQLELALGEVELRGIRLGQVLIEHEAIGERALAIALARQAGLSFIDLHVTEIDQAVATLLPEQFARQHGALPIRLLEGDAVLVAVADPTNLVTSDDLRLALGLGVELGVAEAGALETAIMRVYRRNIEVFEEAEGYENPELDDIRSDAASPPAIKLVNSIIGLAVEEDASDVHFEPQAKEVIVRARIDGVMRQISSVPKGMQSAVTSRLKVMAELDIAERRAPQDGRLSVRYEGRPLDIRIAILPTTHGEQVVLRIMHQRTGGLGLESLGMSAANHDAFLRAIKQPYGAIIVVGPTGSGKTTTLYAALDRLNDAERVITTIEDPVEYQIPGLNQIDVNVKAGLTFARGLRTMLRSDPDVLMVGEVRDDETARIAIQAAMTGHLVLTTLHTHNAASSVERLVDMGVEPSLIASSVNCIVAQRLARRLCENCSESYTADAADLVQLGLPTDYPEVTLQRGRGCIRCSGTGYKGRVALYEVMPIVGKLRRLIGASTEDLFAAAVAQGMTTLREDGVRLVLEGLSSLDEIRRVTGDRMV
jgi:type IV pilus assembly protein PilB